MGRTIRSTSRRSAKCRDAPRDHRGPDAPARERSRRGRASGEGARVREAPDLARRTWCASTSTTRSCIRASRGELAQVLRRTTIMSRKLDGRTTLCRSARTDALDRSGGRLARVRRGASIGAKIAPAASARHAPPRRRCSDLSAAASDDGRYNTAVLTVISNKRPIRSCARMGARGSDSKMVHTASIRSLLDAPATDYAALARSQGVEGETSRR